MDRTSAHSTFYKHTHTLTHTFRSVLTHIDASRPCLHPHNAAEDKQRPDGSTPLSDFCRLILTVIKIASEGKNLVDCFAATLFLLSSSKPNCNHFTSARHVQLQLLPGQVGPAVQGEAAQIQGEELRLLHEDLFILFIPHPVAHHRQPGALPHLWTAGEDRRGAKDQGQ